MKNSLLSTVFFLVAFFNLQLLMAQGNGGNNPNNPNGPCNTSQPRPITGNQTPCPGSVETYCIVNDRGYTSFDWDVPRAHAGSPPTGWVIISGQGTNCVTVRVGTKPGTMKVKVTDPICGTKVATLPVHPGTLFKVEVQGPDTVCANVDQTFTAIISDSIKGNGNGNGNKKGDFAYNWTVPAGWMIVSGQGTQKVVVKPGPTQGQVCVNVNYTKNQNGNSNGNNGIGVGNKKGYCNSTASDCIDAYVNNNCGGNPVCTTPIANITGPDTVCVYGDDPYTFTTPAQANATYSWTVPSDWFIDSGDGTNSITIYAGEEAGYVAVAVTNACGTASDSIYVATEECGAINPLPVSLIFFDGTATDKGAVLRWATATEKNNDRFEIMRSMDGRSFDKIGEVKGEGTTNTRKDYSFTDGRMAAGLVYYQLRQVDRDGTSELSRIVKVNSANKAGATMKLYPNPVTEGNFTVSLSKGAQNATLQVTDINGRLIHSSKVSEGANEVSLSTEKLQMKQGMYLVTVKDANEAITQKLLVK